MQSENCGYFWQKMSVFSQKNLWILIKYIIFNQVFHRHYQPQSFYTQRQHKRTFSSPFYL